MVNYYCDMWFHRSEILAPLTALTSKTVPWLWTPIHEKAFQLTKKIISREVMLSYPQFDQPFIVHTDASHTQLGAVISQSNKPLAFYPRKLTPTQQCYTTTECELLAIVETLKEFKNILLGQEIIIYTDHQNLLAQNCTIERVLRWCLLIEEFNPQFRYIPGHKNIVADTLSRLDLDPVTYSVTQNEELFALSASETLQDLPLDAYPLRFHTIQKYQQLDPSLLPLATFPHYQLTTFSGGGKEYQVLDFRDRIYIPSTLREQVVQWYHTYLCHPGETRTEKLLLNILLGQNWEQWSRRFANNVQPVRKQKNQVKNMDISQRKLQKQIPGKNYVWI